MPIENPAALVEEFKKSGEFDRIRGELLQEFQKDESYAAFQGKIEDVVKQRLAKAQMLLYLPQDMAQKELGQEVDRYPIVERAVADVQLFSDPTFVSGLGDSLQKVLHAANDKETTIEHPAEPDKSTGPPALVPQETKPPSEDATAIVVNPNTGPSTKLLDIAPTAPRLPSPGPPPPETNDPPHDSVPSSIVDSRNTSDNAERSAEAPPASVNVTPEVDRPSGKNDMDVDND